MDLILHNPGDFELEQATIFGASVKDRPNAIGMFGTGVKYSIATLLRNGASVRLLTGGGEFIFHTKPQEVRGVPFDCVWMNDLPLNYTSQLGRNWEPWMAIRELYSNALDEGGGFVDSIPKGGTAFEIKGIDVDLEPYFVRAQKALCVFSNPNIEIFDRPSQWVFYQGFAAHKVPRSGARYTYNIKHKMGLTEERMLSDVYKTQETCLVGILEARDDALLKGVTLGHSWETEQFKWSQFVDHHDTFKWVREVLLPYRREINNSELSFALLGAQKRDYVTRYTAPTSKERLEAIVNRMDKMGLYFDEIFVFSDEEPPEGVIAVPMGCKDDDEDTVKYLLSLQCERQEQDLEGLFTWLILKGL